MKTYVCAKRNACCTLKVQNARMSFIVISGYALSLFVVVFKIFILPASQDKKSDPTQGSKIIFFFATLLLLFSLVPRAIYMSATTMESFLFEEIGASIVYISKLFNNEKTYSGATQIVYALIFDRWRSLVGFSVFSSRALSAIIGVLGILLYYLSFKKIFNKNVALLVAGLISCGLYSSFFSRIAIETGWALTVFALNLYIYSKIQCGQLSRLKYFLLGITVALGLFTYPGYTVGIVCLIPGVLIATLYNNRDSFKNSRRLIFQHAIFFCIGLLSLLIPIIIFHYQNQSHAPFLFGGGVLKNVNVSYLDSVLIQFKDIFFLGQSYYLPFTNCSFVESSLWGFFCIGVWNLVIQKKNSFGIAFLIMLLVLPFGVALALNYPGMRRGVMFLAPFYLFCGVGFSGYIESSQYLTTTLKKGATYIVALMVVLHLFFIQLMTLAGSVDMRPYSHVNDIVLENEFKKNLELYHVVLILDRLTDFDLDYIKHTVFLLNAYEHPAFDLRQSLSVYPSSREIVLNPDRPNLIISNDIKNLLRYNDNDRYCLRNIRTMKTKFYEFYSAELNFKTSDYCLRTSN